MLKAIYPLHYMSGGKEQNYPGHYNDCLKRKLLNVCTRFVLKNHPTAIYPYFRAENSSTGCTSIHRGVCKIL